MASGVAPCARREAASAASSRVSDKFTGPIQAHARNCIRLGLVERKRSHGNAGNRWPTAFGPPLPAGSCRSHRLCRLLRPDFTSRAGPAAPRRPPRAVRDRRYATTALMDPLGEISAPRRGKTINPSKEITSAPASAKERRSNRFAISGLVFRRAPRQFLLRPRLSRHSQIAMCSATGVCGRCAGFRASIDRSRLRISFGNASRRSQGGSFVSSCAMTRAGVPRNGASPVR